MGGVPVDAADTTPRLTRAERVAARRRRQARTFGTIVLINGLLHVLGSAATRSYSPGVITGTALYMPLGILALRLGRTSFSEPTFWAAAAAGVAIHGAVAIVAFWR